MINLTLYKYQRDDGKWTITPRQEEVPIGVDVTLLARLIAEDGMVLYHSITEQLAPCIDTTQEDVPNWEEIVPPEE